MEKRDWYIVGGGAAALTALVGITYAVRRRKQDGAGPLVVMPGAPATVPLVTSPQVNTTVMPVPPSATPAANLIPSSSSSVAPATPAPAASSPTASMVPVSAPPPQPAVETIVSKIDSGADPAAVAAATNFTGVIGGRYFKAGKEVSLAEYMGPDWTPTQVSAPTPITTGPTYTSAITGQLAVAGDPNEPVSREVRVINGQPHFVTVLRSGQVLDEGLAVVKDGKYVLASSAASAAPVEPAPAPTPAPAPVYQPAPVSVAPAAPVTAAPVTTGTSLPAGYQWVGNSIQYNIPNGGAVSVSLLGPSDWSEQQRLQYTLDYLKRQG